MIQKFNHFIGESTGDINLKYYAFDWDDNILHMPTGILMDKKVDGEWKPVTISTAEFAKVRGDKENFRLRDDNPDLAFSEFKDDGTRGKMAFVDDTIKAIKNGDLAPSWDAFIKCLTEGALFAIVTARGHEPETIRRATEWIIDNVLDEEQKFSLYNNCLKKVYRFTSEDVDKFDRLPRGKMSQMPLVKLYLDSCDFYGVSSDSFKRDFGTGSAMNPEKAKEMALDRFVEKCNDFGRRIGAKSVSIGFSDDDPKNVEHVHKFFKEKSALSHQLGHEMKLSLFKTTDRDIKGGERSKFKAGEITETSHQAPGLESSVVPFTKWVNQTEWLYPNDLDSPQDDNHHAKKNQVALANQLYKDFAYKRNKRK